jgi:hypothetical protein
VLQYNIEAHGEAARAAAMSVLLLYVLLIPAFVVVAFFVASHGRRQSQRGSGRISGDGEALDLLAPQAVAHAIRRQVDV